MGRHARLSFDEHDVIATLNEWRVCLRAGWTPMRAYHRLVLFTSEGKWQKRRYHLSWDKAQRRLVRCVELRILEERHPKVLTWLHEACQRAPELSIAP